jgi:hypothetical protein
MKTNLKQSSPVAEYLNPYFISGFADGESSLIITIRKDNNSKVG